MKPAVACFDDGRLFSPSFNDYYAARDPVAETYHVHIRPANLAARMGEAETFTVFEFGFGAGINFLTISEEFLKHSDSEARLRFISCEAFPLLLNTIRRAQLNAAIDGPLAQAFLEFYPPLLSGIYRQLFVHDQVELTLIFANVETALDEFVKQDALGVDSWILDGFAPDRNPEMWDINLISTLARRTRENGTLTTFSSASRVRHSLEQNGFSVQRIEDTPFKRHTTLATYSKSSLRSVQTPSKINIVGGGFAGTSTARALARRGVQVQLFTPTGTVADATSGIPTAVLHPRLSASLEIPAYLRTQTYFYSVALMRYYLEISASGSVQLAGKNMSASRLRDISDILGEIWTNSLNPIELLEITGMEFNDEAAFFPKSMVVNGSEVCRVLVEHPNIEVIRKEHVKPSDGEHMIYATGATSILGNLSKTWETLTIEGQLDMFSNDDESSYPRRVLIKDGYIVPTRSTCVVGSTYEYTRWEPGVATDTNLNKLRNVTKIESWTHQGLFRGSRTVTSDKLPIVGQVCPNTWANLAHGSAGTSSTPLCAEVLASQMCQELAPLWQECIKVLHPSRFKERQVRRPNPLQHRQE